MESGCYTAIATPYKDNAVDYDGLEKLVDFQIQNEITGILAVGTTGESPVLSWNEHNKVIETAVHVDTTPLTKQPKCDMIPGTDLLEELGTVLNFKQ